MAPERVWQQQYADEVSCEGVTNGKSVQNIWACNQQASVALAAERNNNLQMFDPQNIWLLINSIHTSSPTLRATTRIFITEYEVSCDITNIETAPITLTEYRCYARYDQAYRTTETIQLGPPADGSGAPTTNITIDGADKVLKQGFKNTGAQVTTGMGVPINYFDYGVTPFDNPSFTRQFKIGKVRGFKLQPGETKTIKYTYRGNKCFNMQRIVPFEPANSTNQALDQLKGTAISVFSIKGSLAYKADASAGYKVGVGNAAVGMIYKTKIRWTYIDPNYETRNIVNDLPGYANVDGRAPSGVLVRGLVNVATSSGASGAPTSVAGVDDFSGND